MYIMWKMKRAECSALLIVNCRDKEVKVNCYFFINFDRFLYRHQSEIISI